MVKIENNKLILSDNSYYDLEKSSLVRIAQGLAAQCKEGSLSNMDYVICIDKLAKYERTRNDIEKKQNSDNPEKDLIVEAYHKLSGALYEIKRLDLGKIDPKIVYSAISILDEAYAYLDQYKELDAIKIGKATSNALNS